MLGLLTFCPLQKDLSRVGCVLYTQAWRKQRVGQFCYNAEIGARAYVRVAFLFGLLFEGVRVNMGSNIDHAAIPKRPISVGREVSAPFSLGS